MSVASFELPETVDLKSARRVADDLLRHIKESSSPLVNTTGVRQAGVPLLQILVAAKRLADDLGKPFTVQAAPEGALARLLSTYGLDPVQCGATPDLMPPVADHPIQRI
jgi:anti-anti-sigma regulatory factor